MLSCLGKYSQEIGSCEPYLFSWSSTVTPSWHIGPFPLLWRGWLPLGATGGVLLLLFCLPHLFLFLSFPFLINFLHDLIWDFEKALELDPGGEIQKPLLFLPCLFAWQSFLPDVPECGSVWELGFPETEPSAGLQGENHFL